MKTITIIILSWLCLGTLGAQKLTEKHLDFSDQKSLEMNIQIADSISLQTWNKNEVFVKASVNINENKDNEAYLTTFNETGSNTEIKGRFSDGYFKGRENCCDDSEIFWQVWVPEKTDFKIETINGNITITGQTDQMKVKTISGYIDLAVPASQNADLAFSTISGTIYTNHTLNLKKNNTDIPTVIKETLNSGGLPIFLETISGDIFFRKAR
jgi:hypothetical protein